MYSFINSRYIRQYLINEPGDNQFKVLAYVLELEEFSKNHKRNYSIPFSRLIGFLNICAFDFVYGSRS